MKRVTILVIFSFVFLFGFTQKEHYDRDSNFKSVPDSLTTFLEISNYLVKGLVGDREKARAFYIWLAHNIHYDLSLVDSGKEYEFELELINEALERRQGVCQHYAELFHAMCKSEGIESYVIGGYAQDILGMSGSSHAWNLVHLENQYFFIDVTWDAGYIQNGKYIHKFRENYFLKSPAEFINDHIPFDPIWQCLSKPISYQEFESKQFSKVKDAGKFAFKDSIHHYNSKSELEQNKDAYRRIEKQSHRNKLVNNHLISLSLNIQNRQENLSYKLYNNAIDTFNYGVKKYNEFITFRNSLFRKPKMEDEDILILIESAGNAIRESKKQISTIVSSDSEFQNTVNEQLKNVSKLEKDYNTQRDFVARYIEKWKPLRIFLFLEVK